MYFISPWQTLNEEKNNTFIKYKDGSTVFYLQKRKIKIGTCITWYGISLLHTDKKTIHTLLKKAKQTNIIGLYNVIPNYYNDLNLEEASYVKEGFSLDYKWGTYLLNLDNTLDELRSKMPNSLKRNIKKIEKRDYIIKEISDSEKTFKDFVNIFSESRIREGLVINKRLEEDLYGILNSESRKYFVLYIDNIPVACQGICYNQAVAIEVVLAISNYALNEKIYAGDLLKWEIIKWCKEKEIKIYDFAGVSPNPLNKKEEGIKTYKAKWGGDYIEYGVYSKSLSINFTVYKFLKSLIIK